MRKYTLGIDYGTLSVRTVLMDCMDGSVAAVDTMAYPHGVMSDYLPDGKTKLPVNWALEHPDDYLQVLEKTVNAVMKTSGIAKEDVIGLAIDFTSCTVVAADREKQPLCNLEGYKARPHAYAKLWKHHGAQDEADRINELLKNKGLVHQPRYGGAISPELLLPKILEVANDDPEIYEAADVFLEAGDWMTWVLTGTLKRSGNMAAYKAMWIPGEGYVPQEILDELHPCFANLVTEKLRGEVVRAGGKIGCLTKEWAEKLGLAEGIAVGPSIIDSHAGMPGSGIYRPGQMMLVLGTSSVELLLSDHPYADHGVVGCVRGAIMPGYYSLEAGLAAVGDMYGWFADRFCPASYKEAAEKMGMNLHQYLSHLASGMKPGESGLLALDWWNGNKTPYVNGNLSGILLGLNLQTRPEEIYRALIEATAYGTRLIMEEFMKSGATVDEV
ncbi:MAG: ribulokinase, partial [Lachnospiraceae bacterium]|nr:ribulokinase [Lachnospiraceae bacterium]